MSRRLGIVAIALVLVAVAALARFAPRALPPRERPPALPARLREGPTAGDDLGELATFAWPLPSSTTEVSFVYVPPGAFPMGQDGGAVNEAPRHAHALARGFFIARTETTWRQFRAFADATKRAAPAAPAWATADHPVVNVTWADAKAFCDWAGLRLPSEAEWERAARGTDARRFPWGDELPSPERCAFGRLNAAAPAGSFPRGASPVGALDLAGNVWEWTADGYEPTAYERFKRGDLAPSREGPYRVLRGGCFQLPAEVCRTTVRNCGDPGWTVEDVGFRAVLDLPPP